MESRLPKRKALGVNDRSKRIAANHLKFGEAFPRVPLATVNPDNPPLYQSARTRATSPDPREGRMEIDRYALRRSRSISDLNHLKIMPLKRGAVGTVDSIPAKLARMNVLPKPATSTTLATKSSSNGMASKGTASGIASITSKPAAGSLFRRPVTRPATTSASIAKKNPAAAPVVAKVAVKRIPSYDYKTRFNDISEKFSVLKEKYAEVKSRVDDADRMEQDLGACQEEVMEMRSELESVQNQLSTEIARNKASEKTIRHLTSQIEANEAETKTLNENIGKLTAENDVLLPKLEKLQKVYSETVEELAEFKVNAKKSEELLFESNIARKQLHNDLLDLKGNIRVFCRVRPPLDVEKSRLMCGWQYVDETSLEISTVDNGKRLRHDFAFDQVFHPQSTQSDVFELVSPLIQSAFDGYNVCIFAYGQTGSSKTFTMEGTTSKMGIIPNTVDLLFSSVENYKLLGWSYNISVTFLEIYNEVLYDLLSNDQKEMDIRMVNPKTPHEIYVSNLTEFTVESVVDLRELIEVANSHRATAATVSNERSSRSHAVTQIKLTGTHHGRGEKCIGKINLIDLAGSESPKTSSRMDETKNINRSLSELTNVIMALLNQNDHVPYRNSKLTHLLMPSLGGNSKTLMFINVAPFDDCFKESVKSLRFAANVNACKLNKARKNKVFVE